VSALVDCFPSQVGRTWWKREVFLSLMRLRGTEAGAPSGLAEAFFVRRAVMADLECR